MAFHGIRPLEKNQTICITFKLDDTDESVTATAKIVWLTDSRKGGALQFIDLPEVSQRLIKNWILEQGQVGDFKESPTAAISQIEAKGLPSIPAVPLAANHGKFSGQTATIVAAPPPSSSVSSAPIAETAQAITLNVTPKAKPDIKKSLSIQHSHSSMNLPRASRIPTLPARDKKKLSKKHAWIRSYRVGLAASFAMTIITGVMLWPLRGDQLRYLLSNIMAYRHVQFTSAPTAALSPEQTVLVDPSSDSTIMESLPLAPIAIDRENLTRPIPPAVTISAPTHPAGKPTPLMPQINHGTTSKVPVHSANDLGPRGPAIMPAQNEQSTAALPNLILEGKDELPRAGTAEEKNSSLEGKLPGNPVSAVGSIEITSDPYPSIRVPAESKGRPSRPGTSLQIGRLVSKVEPQYPHEALRQRIAGAAKVHVVIGRNGTVERAELLDGPELLAEAALRAVQQWHYEPTMLGGAAIEVEEDITVVFRIASPLPPAN
jgi:TonB family protein